MKNVFFILFLITAFASFGQPVPVKINDSLWSIQSTTLTGQNGARTVTFSDFADSSTIIGQYQNIVESRFNVIANRINEREFQKMDSVLQSLTGESFDVMIKRKIEADIKGSWAIKDDSGIKKIVIEKTIVKDTTGRAIGTVEINSRESITINGVIDKPLVFRATPEGVFATINKQRYQLIKS